LEVPAFRVGTSFYRHEDRTFDSNFEDRGKTMAPKKRTVKQEPLLNIVARKLGHAAGTLTKVTQELTENLSALPENVTAKVREAAHIGDSAKRSRARNPHARKRISRTAQTHRMKMKAASGSDKRRKSPTDKSPRRRPKPHS
jgi:hypothetical protein